jgi:hypothetical protein
MRFLCVSSTSEEAEQHCIPAELYRHREREMSERRALYEVIAESSLINRERAEERGRQKGGEREEDIGYIERKEERE